MQTGIAYVIGACLCWGLVFILPNLVRGFSAFEVVLGRCFFFGLLSLLILLFQKKRSIFSFSKKIWITGALLALVGSLLHYLTLVLSLRYVNPTIPTLFMGLSPVCVAFVDNFRSPKQRKDWALSCTCILAGLLLINLPHLHFNSHASAIDYTLGIFWSLIALITWVFFIMGSALFLKKTPEITSADWITVLGLSTFLWAIIIAIIIFSPLILAYPIDKFLIGSDEMIKFLLSTLLLGFCSSWLGSYMWNQAALRIPLGLAGQLSILEAVFGLLFIHLAAWKFPSTLELVGTFVIFSGILLSIKTKKPGLTHG